METDLEFRQNFQVPVAIGQPGTRSTADGNGPAWMENRRITNLISINNKNFSS